MNFGPSSELTSYLLTLPEEVLLHILSYLLAGDLSRLAQVCKILRDLAEDDTLWRNLAKTQDMALRFHAGHSMTYKQKLKSAWEYERVVISQNYSTLLNFSKLFANEKNFFALPILHLKRQNIQNQDWIPPETLKGNKMMRGINAFGDLFIVFCVKLYTLKNFFHFNELNEESKPKTHVLVAHAIGKSLWFKTFSNNKSIVNEQVRDQVCDHLADLISGKYCHPIDSIEATRINFNTNYLIRFTDQVSPDPLPRSYESTSSIENLVLQGLKRLILD